MIDEVVALEKAVVKANYKSWLSQLITERVYT